MRNRFTIGREKSADIPIADDSVSRHHAEITLLEGGKVFLTDCRSSNGTFVIRHGAAQRIQQETVMTGDTVRLGNVTLAVSDLLAAIRKRADAAAGHAGNRALPLGQPSGAGRLIRCDCGAVRPPGGACPACGQ